MIERVLVKKKANIFIAIGIFAIALFFVQMTPQKVYAYDGATSDGFFYNVYGSHATITSYQWTGGETDITIPKTVTYDGKTYTVNGIGSGAFDAGGNGQGYDVKLTSITIPDTVTSIGDSAFSRCSGLTKFTIPDSVTSIDSFAFDRCTSLTDLIIPKNVVSIGSCVFQECSGLENVTISRGVTSIGEWQFYQCNRLTNVTMPDTITSIGSHAFGYCENLTSIVIPNSVTSINDYVFTGCISLKNVTISNSINSIGNCAFEGCTSLANITIPSSVTSILGGAFHECTLLEKVTFLGNAPSMGSGWGYRVFDSCPKLLKFDYLYGNTGFARIWYWLPAEPFYVVNVNYVGNGSTSGTVPVDSNAYSQGDTVTISGNTGSVTKNGYTFAGWNTAANGYGTNYNSGEEFVAGTYNETLYAKWIIKSYAITFDSQSGSAVTSETKNYNSLITNPINPTKVGYRFGGWYKENTCNNAWNFITDKVTTNTRLYAKWIATPGTPTNLKATSSSYNSINFSWSAINGATGYEVYRGTSATAVNTFIAIPSEVHYNDTELTTSSTYYYKVRTYRVVGNIKVYSDFSSVISSKPVLSTLTSLKASSSSYNSINVSWKNVIGANGYEVYSATSVTGASTLVATTTGASYNNTGLTTNSIYYYKVRAYRMVGTVKVYSDFTNMISSKPILSTPTSVKATSFSCNSINVNWSAVTGANGYEVYRGTVAAGVNTLVATTTGASYNNVGLATNSNSYYRVRAYRMIGTVKVYSGFSSVIGSKTMPTVPTSVKAGSSSYNSINVSWKAVTGVSGYEVYRGTSTSANTLVAMTAKTSYNNTGLLTNSNYYYRVRAYSLNGTAKVYSNFTTIVSSKPILAIPTSVKATSSSYNSVKVSWKATAGANGYEVYRSTSASGANTTRYATLNSSYNSVGLATNSIYYYKVRAYRMLGRVKVYGSFSSVIGAKPVLGTVVNVKATRINSKSIKLTFSKVTGASGYEVCRATSIKGSYSIISRITSSYYTNSSLVKGRTYYYKIRSYRMVGKTRVYSNYWSVIVHAKV